MSNGEQQVPPTENVVGSLLDIERTRRQVIIGATVIGVASAVGVTRGIWAEQSWPGTTTSMSVLRESREQFPVGGPLPPLGWLGWGGLGNYRNEVTIREFLGGAFDFPKEPVLGAHVDIANQGFTTLDIALCLYSFSRECERWAGYGRSVGSLLALQAATVVGGVFPMEYLVIGDSPADPSDTYQEDAIEAVVKSGEDGDVVDKFVFDLMTTDSNRGGILGYLQKARKALGTANEGTSPIPYIDQLRVLSGRLLDKVGLFGDIITDRTVMIDCRTEHDAVVKPQAREKYEALAASCGATFIPVDVPDAGHADNAAIAKAVRPILASHNLLAQ